MTVTHDCMSSVLRRGGSLLSASDRIDSRRDGSLLTEVSEANADVCEGLGQRRAEDMPG